MRARALSGVVVSLGVIICMCTGCTTLDYRDHDAPGEIDVSEKPQGRVVAGWQRVPDDPGEEGVTARLSGQIGAVEWWLSEPDRGATHSLGIGSTVEYLWRPTSHTFTDADGKLGDVRPYWSTGLHVGIEPLVFGAGVEKVRPGAVIVEGVVARRAPGAMRLGYEYVPATGSSGPRMTIEMFGIAWVGSSYRLDRGWSLEVGVSPRYIWGWVWSQ